MKPRYLSIGQATCDATEGSEIPCAGSGQDAKFTE
jgi:hypothetical protein